MQNEFDEENVLKIRLNRFFLNYKLRKCINNFSPCVILYFPESSVTTASFLRAKMLKVTGRSSKVVVLGIQHREYSAVEQFILQLLKPDLLLLMGRSDEEFFIQRGFNVKILPPAVDATKFFPPQPGKKERYGPHTAYPMISL